MEVSGGVCAAKGFKAAGIHCGVRKKAGKKDLALLYCDVPAAAAATYTTNKVKAAPLLLTADHLKGKTLRAILANSGNANACAPKGYEHAAACCKAAADALGVPEEQVAVASTGVIGVELPVSPILSALPKLAESLSAGGSHLAAEAIMTTDLAKKELALRFELDGRPVSLGGIAKGSGMIHPNMGTMLAFLTTDCAISPEMLEKALVSSVKKTYNRVSVDGDTSTNDMCILMASGKAGNAPITGDGPDFDAFCQALDHLNTYLARSIAKDGEGATKLITVTVKNAGDEAAAETLAKAIAASSLVKTAMFGADANWGRVLCAMGYSGAAFPADRVSVSFRSAAGEVAVCQGSAGLPFDEGLAKQVLSEKEVLILADVHDGDASVTAWGCDLSYDYVKINGDYRT